MLAHGRWVAHWNSVWRRPVGWLSVPSSLFFSPSGSVPGTCGLGFENLTMVDLEAFCNLSLTGVRPDDTRRVSNHRVTQRQVHELLPVSMGKKSPRNGQYVSLSGAMTLTSLFHVPGSVVPFCTTMWPVFARKPAARTRAPRRRGRYRDGRRVRACLIQRLPLATLSSTRVSSGCSMTRLVSYTPVWSRGRVCCGLWT